MTLRYISFSQKRQTKKHNQAKRETKQKTNNNKNTSQRKTFIYFIFFKIRIMLFFVFFFPEKDDVDFENSRLGMWGNSNTDNLNWNFNRGFTSTIHTGPDKDHTNGQG